MQQQNQQGVVFSIDRIGAELTNGNDALAQWAREKGAAFFLSTADSAAMSYMTQIAAWLTEGKMFQSHVVSKFLSGADPFLIAYGLAHGHTIVTHEVFQPNQRNKIKIPAVCREFDVHYMTLFELLRLTGAKLILR